MIIPETEINSKETRVQPVFRWLIANGGMSWANRLVELAHGLSCTISSGDVVNVQLDPEAEIKPSPARLAWMLRNAEALVPQNGKAWRSLLKRVADRDAVDRALALLDLGELKGLPQGLGLEGPTSADCLIECEHAFIWIEGKRFDWLSPSITWDVSRDQLARGLEAVWLQAQGAGEDYCVLICHEAALKHHERHLIDGYRNGTWSAGWPHIDEKQRREFAERIGTVRWIEIVQEWPEMRSIPELHDVS